MQRSKIVEKNNFKKNFLKKFLNFFKKNKNENSLEEVIKNFLNKRIKNKLPLKIDEEQIISNVFELPEKLISNIMIPRSDIISIDENSTLSELIKLITFSELQLWRVFSMLGTTFSKKLTSIPTKTFFITYSFI